MLPQQPSEKEYQHMYGSTTELCTHNTTYPALAGIKCAMCHKLITPVERPLPDDDGGMQDEVDLLRRQLKEAEFFYNEKKDIIEAMEREYEELEFECSEFKGIAHKYEREI